MSSLSDLVLMQESVYHLSIPIFHHCIAGPIKQHSQYIQGHYTGFYLNACATSCCAVKLCATTL